MHVQLLSPFPSSSSLLPVAPSTLLPSCFPPPLLTTNLLFLPFHSHLNFSSHYRFTAMYIPLKLDRSCTRNRSFQSLLLASHLLNLIFPSCCGCLLLTFCSIRCSCPDHLPIMGPEGSETCLFTRVALPRCLAAYRFTFPRTTHDLILIILVFEFLSSYVSCPVTALHTNRTKLNPFETVARAAGFCALFIDALTLIDCNL